MIAERTIGPNKDTVRVNTDQFFRFTESLWSEARDAGRAYLTWEQWDAWAKMAIRCRLVRAEDFSEDPGIPQQIGMPFKSVGKGLAVDGLFWRWAVLKTWARVAEAQVLGLTPQQFHRDEEAAKRADALRWKERDERQARERSEAMTAASRSSKSRHAGAAGEL